MMNATVRALIRHRSHIVAGWIWPIVLVALLMCVAGPRVLAASEEKLPEAETILDKYVEVTGGQAAYDRITNRVIKSTFEIMGQGAKMSVTVYEARPNKTYVVVEAAMFGMIMSGTNDDVVWETSTMRGPQIKKGKEKADALREAVFDKFVGWRKLYKKAECTGVGTVADKPCYKIAMTPHEGNSQTFYYDQASNLLVKTGSVVENPGGPIPIPVETFLSDYRKVDGIMMAHKVSISVMGQERVMTIESVQHNVEMPEDRFALPEDVQALVDKEKGEGQDPESK